MDEIYEMEKRKERSNTTAPPGARGHLAPLEAQREKDKEAYLVLKPAVFGVMMPLTLGTESMMPLGDQKWLVSASRIFSSKSPRVRPDRTFLAGTRPGLLRPGTAMALAAAGTAKSAAMAARRVIAEPSASICGEAARCGAAAGAKAAAGEKADAVAQRPSEAMERSSP